MKGKIKEDKILTYLLTYTKEEPTVVKIKNCKWWFIYAKRQHVHL